MYRNSIGVINFFDFIGFNALDDEVNLMAGLLAKDLEQLAQELGGTECASLATAARGSPWRLRACRSR